MRSTKLTHALARPSARAGTASGTRWLVALVAGASLAAAFAGCVRLGYVIQAGFGQLHLWSNRRPVADVIADPATEPETRRMLSEVSPILAFARERGLESKGNYADYVQLESGAVVWFMAVSEPLAFEPMVWSFPIVGGFTYLGWFSRDEARAIGAALEDEGWDVYIRSVRAYSTGGWFRDPVLSTMFRSRSGESRHGAQAGPNGTTGATGATGANDANDSSGGVRAPDLATVDFANLLFHELTHANVFIPSQSTFNESIATFVGDAIAEEYIEQRFGADSAELLAFRDAAARAEQAGARMAEAYEALAALYEGDAPAADKRARKRQILAALDGDLRLHYQPNNASLMGFKTYNAGLPELAALYEACGRTWDRFFAAIRTLDTGSFGAPQADDIGPTIARLTAAECPRGAARTAARASASVRDADTLQVGGVVVSRGRACLVADR